MDFKNGKSDDAQKRRFFHKTPVRVDSFHAYDFILTQKGVWSFFDKRLGSTAGKNMLFVMNFYLGRCSTETPKGKSTSKRDIAQTHWFSQSTIAEDIGFQSVDSVRQAVKALVDAGILIQEHVKGKATYTAFSDKFIAACEYFSTQREREVEREFIRLDMQNCQFAAIENVRCFFASPDGRHWLPRRYSLTPQTVAVDSPDGPKSPYIEESSKEIVKKNPQMNAKSRIADVVNEDEPEEFRKLAFIRDDYVKVIKLSEKVEKHVWTDRYKTPTYDETNLFVSGLIDSHGLKRVWLWTQWLPSLLEGRSWRKGMSWEQQMQCAWDLWSEASGGAASSH